MKKLIYKLFRVCMLPVLLLSLFAIQGKALPPPSDFTISVLNFTQPTDRTIEFDVYLLDTDNSQSFELASVQLGFLLNSNIFTGGTLTAAIDNTGSGLVAAQQFNATPGIVTPVTGYPDQTLLRLAGRTPPGANNGTIISATGNGTLLTHFILTSTVPWSSSLTANLVFNSSTATIPLYATRVSQYISNVNTALVVAPGANALICCNPPLNAFPPAVFSVTGSGAYCEGGAGLPVGLSGSETSASYQLYLDGNIDGAPVQGTGSPLSFGNKTAGTYTVVATNGSGSIPMNGNAVLTTNPMPLQPGAFTTSTTNVYQGATGIVYTVPNDPSVTYLWSYSGTGATITGTTNSVTVNYSATATSGTLSVSATNSCGTSAPTGIAITVNALLPDEYELSVQNLTQPTDRTIEFDVYLLDTDPLQPLELASVQLGFLLNSDIYTGGTLSAAISNTGSGLIPAQQFTALPGIVQSVQGYPNQTLLRLAGRVPPGAGNGTIISSTGNGTLLTHFILTSTVAWTPNSLASLVFTSSSAVNPLYATRISVYNGTTNTALTVTPGLNALVCCNPVLNNFPLAFNVMGSGSYCEGENGLPVTLSGSEIGVTYTMYGGPTPEPTIEGTGSAISFGNQLAGTYTISGTNLAGTTVMNGSAVITENPLLTASLSIAEDANNVCAGTTVNLTATPVNGGASPIISWYKNSVLDGTGLTYSFVPLNGDAVYAIMDADPALACVTGSPASSNTVSMVVNALLPASITISADANPVNAGTLVTFTASPVNGGATPTIQWYVNALPQTTGLSFAFVPVNGDQVTAVLTADPTLACVTGSPATSDIITMTVNELTKVLNITGVMLEGLFNGTNMNQAFNDLGPQWPAGISDHVTIELHSSSTYSTIEYAVADAALSTTGTLSIEIPATYSGNYYVTIKHRNSIETTTATPVVFSGNQVNLDFSNQSNVFGGNLKNINGTSVIYSGDVNHDGAIDSGDMSLVFNLAINAASGYLTEDVNGDGTIDSLDMSIVFNNAIMAIGAVTP